jgi:tetratricopeptide (TPR) repeat protein
LARSRNTRREIEQMLEKALAVWPRVRGPVAAAAFALTAGLGLAVATSADAGAASLDDCRRGDLISRIMACDDLIADSTTDAATRAAALVSRGYAIYLRSEQTDEALANFTSAILIDPDNVAAHIGLGTMHLFRKELDQAEAALNTAVKIAPDNPDAWSALGEVYDARGKNEEALAQFDKALALDSRLPMANLNKADTLAKLDRKGEALALYRFTLYLFDPRSQQSAYARQQIDTLEKELGQ